MGKRRTCRGPPQIGQKLLKTEEGGKRNVNEEQEEKKDITFAESPSVMIRVHSLARGPPAKLASSNLGIALIPALSLGFRVEDFSNSAICFIFAQPTTRSIIGTCDTTFFRKESGKSQAEPKWEGLVVNVSFV